MIIILSIVTAIIATVLLVGQYYKVVDSDYRYFEADEAFYKYKNISPFQKEVKPVSPFKSYELIDSNNYDILFPLTGKTIKKGTQSGTTCIGLTDYGKKMQPCTNTVSVNIFEKYKDDSGVVKEDDSATRLQKGTQNVSSLQISDPLLLNE